MPPPEQPRRSRKSHGVFIFPTLSYHVPLRLGCSHRLKEFAAVDNSTGPSSDLRIPVLCPLTGERMWVRIRGPSEEDRFRVLACERFPGGEIHCGVECADSAIPAVCRLRSTVYRPSSDDEARYDGP